MNVECHIRELLSPCIDLRSPYAKVLIVELAKLVYDEREACAVIADAYVESFENTAVGIAAAIRARHAADTSPPES